ncbi:MAG: ATP-binding protein [Candidatus Kapabacteria bacterium]|jgi:two-component system NtrC family sensor kinase|nr:ATP-binding protein [Candidatus Kapabacteria bacterium]
MSINGEWHKSDFDLMADKNRQNSSNKHYRRLLKYSIITTTFVAIVPLIIMLVINYYQYRKAYLADIMYPISRQTSNISSSLESFINERRSALNLVIREKEYSELADKAELAVTFKNLKESFDGFVDISLINSDGDQAAYFGPYNLEGKNYKDQDWFHETCIKGSFVSDIFMGFRGMPHFVIAIYRENSNGSFYILRATIESDMLYHKILSQNQPVSSDAFILNQDQILQSPSKYHGNILEKSDIEVPPYSLQTEVIESQNNGTDIIIGYAYIKNTPFILIEITNPASIMSNWVSASNNLLGLVIVCIILMIIVIVWISRRMVSHVRHSDMKWMKMLSEISNTNKMASVGRLAAGVSHEINNPLAIISENAGMVLDIMSVTDEFQQKTKISKHLNSIIKAVDRCSNITHRLLGFAKRMDTKTEGIDILLLLKEVVGFDQSEAQNRNINIDITGGSDIMNIESDRGQLQQVFLNILNNALDAVKSGDTISVHIEQVGSKFIRVAVSDTGSGIPKADLERIFEPFYTTKKENGTGLGLSITYGIVIKLGGSMKVKSTQGEGTTFIVDLPIVNNQK